MLFRIGLRNIFRNKRRTAITIFALGVGIGALILADAFILGTIDAMKNGVVNTLTGEIQLHHKDFTKSREVEFSFDPKPYEKKLSHNKDPLLFSERVIAGAMVTSPQGSQNISLYGIDSQREVKIIDIEKKIVQGKLFGNEKVILIGTELAKVLDVRLGEKVSLTTSEVGSGDLVQELFRIGGIFKYGTREIDKYIAFIPLIHANSMLNMKGLVHEIVVKSKGLDDEKLSITAAKFSDNTVESKTWRELNSSISSAIDMSRYSSMIIAAVLLVIIAFGIMNTMFMSIYERTYEFGILKAIGTRPFQLFKLILIESFCLGGMGAIFGIILGLIFSLWLQRIGIDYSDVEMGAIGFTEPLRPLIVFYQYVVFPALFWCFTVLVSIYPAIFTAKINPVKAIRD